MANPYPADVADSGGNVRLSGAITFTDANNQPGGTPLPPLARNVGQSLFTFSDARVFGDPLEAVTLIFDAGDATMVDLTTPAAPKMIEAGLYAIMARAYALGATSVIELLVDDNYHSPYSYNEGSYNEGAVNYPVATTITWWGDANDPFFVKTAVKVVDSTSVGQVYVQRIR